ncbi:MAG TPA: alpha/beta fold hydrolase [Thermoanaerobaculia bacterium]|nr:alpha/beta fold hydrolase [Thermoanaerobaculia bacterium]
MDAPVLVLPGLGNSGPEHWQTIWERANPGFVRVLQRDWERPERDVWVAALEAAVTPCRWPPVLVCHSLGCLTAVHWAGEYEHPVSGALLVAPPDADRPDASLASRSFRPIPRAPLLFPSILVASSNDPYVSLERSRELARAWASRLVDIGPAGHINAAAGYGAWPEGGRLLSELREAFKPR